MPNNAHPPYPAPPLSAASLKSYRENEFPREDDRYDPAVVASQRTLHTGRVESRQKFWRKRISLCIASLRGE